MALQTVQIAENEGGAASILVIDDSQPMRDVIALVLRDAHYAVVDAGTIAEAEHLIAQRPFDLILLDIHLSDSESGIDFLHQLVPRHPDTAVVMMTGTGDTQTAVDCLRDGAYDYLLKPFRPAELLRVVKDSLNRRNSRTAERQRAEDELNILARFPAESPDPIFRVLRDGTLLYANDAAVPLLHHWGTFVAGKISPDLSKMVTAAGAAGVRREVEVKLKDEKVYAFTVAPIEGADFVYLYGHDITDRVAMERELIQHRNRAEWMALHDRLTELPNRTLLEKEMQKSVEDCLKNGRRMAVVYIDLNNFKQINDVYGHRTGDTILVSFARHFGAAIRKTDVLGRWGGDEMILLLRDVGSGAAVRDRCSQLQKQVEAEVAADVSFDIQTSMGVALCPDDASTPEGLLQRADNALYLAKARRPNSLVLIQDEVDRKGVMMDKTTLPSMLSRAIREDSLEVWFQPIFNCAGDSVVAAEALARWCDDRLGWIPPETFVPAVAQIGLLDDFSRQIVRRALSELKRWREAGHDVSLSVNASIRQVSSETFIRDISRLLDDFGLPPGSLTIEITESELLIRSQWLDRLSAAGFRLSIDDFGQGYSSLAQLYDMPVDELKIDRSFAKKLATKRGEQIMRTMVTLARNLDLCLVAEGIEDAGSVKILQAMGIDRLQGYHFSQPLPPELFFNFLERKLPV